jgi:nucleoside-diphosphate-sugar epimerase
VKVLFIGGTGNISTVVSRAAVSRGIDLTLLNRGKTGVIIPGAGVIKADISDEERTAAALGDSKWDAVVNWIAYTEDDVKRDIRLFSGRTDQYIFISSASAYQKPVSHPVITESTPLANRWWEYSRNKIACENRCLKAYREKDFPITIVRPSYTYDTVIPVAMGGFREYTVVDRMLKGKKIIVHGDGTSIWVNTHAEDFAAGFLGLIGHQQAIGHAFHITSDELLTWDQIYRAVGHAAGVEPDIIHIPSDFICGLEPRWTGDLLGDKAHSVIFDNTKIKTFVPEYRAVIPFKQGIKRTLGWFREDPSRQTVSEETNAAMDRIIAAFSGS